MKKIITVIAVTVLFFPLISKSEKLFKQQQMRSSRVKTAYREKSEIVKKIFKDKGFEFPNVKVFLRVLKKERRVELWAAEKSRKAQYKLVKSYRFCDFSGELGPKRVQGDGQTPEGFYHIDRFNAWSSFYLSLGVNYPNKSDRILGNKRALGGDIFIHGNCVTIGCVPITDDKIKELYMIAVEARANGQRVIPVHIFPGLMDDEGWSKLKKQYTDRRKLISFWENLRVGYQFFENNRKLPKVSVNSKGEYRFR